MKLFAKRSPPKLLNIRNEKAYSSTEYVENYNIKTKCKWLSAKEFENLDENNGSLEKQFIKTGRSIRKSK